METTLEKVVRIVTPLAAARLDSVTEKTRIVDDLDVSSADMIEIVLGLEDEFGIEIPDEETGTLETIGDVRALVDRKLAGGASAS